MWADVPNAEKGFRIHAINYTDKWWWPIIYTMIKLCHYTFYLLSGHTHKRLFVFLYRLCDLPILLRLGVSYGRSLSIPLSGWLRRCKREGSGRWGDRKTGQTRPGIVFSLSLSFHIQSLRDQCIIHTGGQAMYLSMRNDEKKVREEMKTQERRQGNMWRRDKLIVKGIKKIQKWDEDSLVV